MRKLIFLVALLFSCLLAQAQMSRWIMKPAYDSIYIAPGVPVLISDSLGTTSLWNLNGKRMATTSDRVHPFVEGYAVVTAKGTDDVKGFYNTKGQWVALKDYTLSYNFPYFSNGFLLVNNQGFTQFINPQGELADMGNYEQFYPFYRGLAVAMTYRDVEKKKDPYYAYITTSKRVIPFELKAKPVDVEDVQFVSSLNEEGQGVVVIKHKVYFFNQKTGELQPVFAGKGAQYQKKQLTLDGSDPSEYLIYTADSIVLKTKASKKELVTFAFNAWLKPVRYQFMDYAQEFKAEVQETQRIPSSLSSLTAADTRQVGLKMGNEVVLPPQFDEVGFCFYDFAVVRQQDKWGMLLYDKALKYRLSMHGGKAIAFRHRDITTDIKLELPAVISADHCRFEVDEKAGCVIDKISIQTKNTEHGNYVSYQCNLTIPEALPDVLTDIQYPVQISYDGLQYPVVPITTKAWHYKYMTVSLDDSEMKIDQGSVTFAFDIHIDKQPGDDDYPFQLTVNADGLQPELTKISEIRYECTLNSLVEGTNTIQVNILEAGCPPSVFPFEICYVKPNKRKGARGKEEVHIGKLGSTVAPLTPTDSLKVDSVQVTNNEATQQPATPAIMQELIQEVSPM